MRSETAPMWSTFLIALGILLLFTVAISSAKGQIKLKRDSYVTRADKPEMSWGDHRRLLRGGDRLPRHRIAPFRSGRLSASPANRLLETARIGSPAHKRGGGLWRSGIDSWNGCGRCATAAR